MNMKSLILNSIVKQYLKNCDSNPQKFLANNRDLKYRIIDYSNNEVDDVFIIYYDYTIQLISRRNNDNLR